MTMLETTLRIRIRYDTIVAGLVRLNSVLSRYAYITEQTAHTENKPKKSTVLDRWKKLNDAHVVLGE